MNVQQFHAGETAEATVEFIHGDRVGRVTATFVHADDPATKLLLSGGAGYAYWRVTLSGEVTTGEKLGEYRLESLEAEYPGGRKVPFGNERARRGHPHRRRRDTSARVQRGLGMGQGFVRGRAGR